MDPHFGKSEGIPRNSVNEGQLLPDGMMQKRKHFKPSVRGNQKNRKVAQ